MTDAELAHNGPYVNWRERAAREPLGIDISDYGDEWCAGFLQGQVNAIDALAAAGFTIAAPGQRVIDDSDITDWGCAERLTALGWGIAAPGQRVIGPDVDDLAAEIQRSFDDPRAMEDPGGPLAAVARALLRGGDHA